MQQGETLPIVISGAGIGGLATAIALGRIGRRVTVFEQAAQIMPIGYGIQLAPNAFHMFDRLGIRDLVLEKGNYPLAGMFRDIRTAEKLAVLPMGNDIVARYGQPYVVTHRGDLHDALLKGCAALPNVTIETGVKVEGYTLTERGVQVETSAGLRAASALVGADGVWSTLRKQIDGPRVPQNFGYYAYRAVIDRAALPDDLYENVVALWVGPGHHMIHYPMRNDELYNVVAVFRSARFASGLPGAGDAEELDEMFAGAVPPVARLLGFVNRTRSWNIAVMNPIDTWRDGPVTLLGDAAHPMLQSLAQGACQSIEDGVALGDAIAANPDDLAAAFAAFEQERRYRALQATYQSRHFWEIYHCDGAYADLRRHMLAEDAAATLERTAWLYDAANAAAVRKEA